MRIEGGSALTLHWQFAGGALETLSAADLVDAASGSPDLLTTEVVELGGVPMFNPVTPFLAAARDGAPAPLPMAEALPAHRIVDALYESAANGGTPFTGAE